MARTKGGAARRTVYPVRMQDGRPLDAPVTAPVEASLAALAAELGDLEAAVLLHLGDGMNPHAVTPAQIGGVRALRRPAVVDAPVGVTRAFLADAWAWGPVRLGRVLYLASLRG